VAAAVAERDHVGAAVAGLGDVEDEVGGVIERYPGVAAVATALSCDPGYERALGAALSRLQAGVEVPEGVDHWELLAALRAAGARLVRLVLPRTAHGEGADAGYAATAATDASGAMGEPLLSHVRGAGGRVAGLLAQVCVVADLAAVPAKFGGLAVTKDGAYYSPRDGELGLAGALPAAVLLERRSHLESLCLRVAALEKELAAAQVVESESRAAAEEAGRRRHEASRAATAAREVRQRAEREETTAVDAAREVESLLARAARDAEAHQGEAAELEGELERLEGLSAQLLVRGETLAGPLAEAEAALVGLEEAHDRALAAHTRVRVELEERSAIADRIAQEREQVERRRAEGRARLETIERRLAALPTVLAVSSALLARFGELQSHAERLVNHLGAPADEEGLDHERLRGLADREATLRRAAEELAERRASLQVSMARLDVHRGEVAESFDAVAAQLERARFEPPADAADAQALTAAAERVQRRMESIGPVNPLAEAECAELAERATFLREQRRDLERSLEELGELIADLTTRIDRDFAQVFAVIQDHFAHMMETLFPGGRGHLSILGPEAEADAGGVALDIKPGRKLGKRLSMLSGGERALAAIAFLMALVLANPAPFYILDEVEAALDDVNIGRLVALLREYRSRTQFIIITHQKRTMEAADILYGVTMGQDGASHVVSARMAEEEIDKEAAAQPRE
jgi:chromosome segregation protein